MKLCKELIGLSNECKVRYIEKVQSIFEYNSTSSQDPYLICKEKFFSVLESNSKDLPNLAYPDIYHYLVHGVSAYTNEELKAYKSTEAYSYFVAGFIGNVECLKVFNTDNFIVKSQVSC